MVAVRDLRKIARDRLKDAEVLLGAKRYDGAVYLCGYAAETALKARICRTLKWTDYPDRGEDYRNFRTHKLDVLLHLSGVEAKIKEHFFDDWSIIADWEPGVRYKPSGNISAHDASEMIAATKTIMNAL